MFDVTIIIIIQCNNNTQHYTRLWVMPFKSWYNYYSMSFIFKCIHSKKKKTNSYKAFDLVEEVTLHASKRKVVERQIPYSLVSI